MANRPVRAFARLRVPPRDPFQVVSSLDSDDLSPGAELDFGMVLDTVDQVARHGVAETTGPDEHVDLPSLAGQEHGRLPCRVATAHDGHLFPGAEPLLHGRGAVINPRSF